MVESNKKKKGKKTQVTPDVKSKQKKMTSRNSAQPNSLQQPQNTTGLSEEHLQEYGEIFMAFDHDGDGSITYDQLLELMKYLGYDTDSSAAFGILEDIDVNGNDLVEFEEFLLLLKLQNCDRDQLVKEAFKVLDPSGTGVITSESLEKVCADLNLNIPKEELTEMVAKADPEGKGTVDLQGLKTLMRERTQTTLNGRSLDSERQDVKTKRKQRPKRRRRVKRKKLWRSVWMHAFKLAAARKIHGNMDMYRTGENKIRGFPTVIEPVQFIGKPTTIPPTKRVHGTPKRNIVDTQKPVVTPFGYLIRNEPHLGFSSPRKQLSLPGIRPNNAKYHQRYSMYYIT